MKNREFIGKVLHYVTVVLQNEISAKIPFNFERNNIKIFEKAKKLG